MKRKNWRPKGETEWCFAVINRRLGEIYFRVGKSARGVYAHGYVDRKKFTKREQKMIDEDIKKYRFTYRNKQYRRVGERKPLPTRRFRIPKRKGKLLSLEALSKL